MTDEFSAVLKLIRTDFKKINSFFTDTHDSLDEVVRIIKKHKLGTYVCALGKNDLPLELTERLWIINGAYIQQFNKIQNLIFLLENIVEKAGLHFAVIKGIGLNNYIYGSDVIRNFGDLDILVRSEDAADFNRIFNDIGFYQKMGPTSTAFQYNRYARAFLAVHANNSDKTYSSLPFPIKKHQDKPEYIAYYRQDEPNIEMHDGLYFLSDSAIKKMIEGTVRITKEGGSYTTLDAEHTFILLLTNTFENSESFFSNTYDFGAVLRDYVDLRFFFEKYKSILNWDKVEKIINEFGIHNIAEIVIGNLCLVYDRDVTIGCLPSIKPMESEWGIGILERMFDADLSRRSSLAVMRKRWLAEGTSAILLVSTVSNQINFDHFHRCISCSDALYNIEYTPDSFMLSWAIPPMLQEKSESLLYQFRFFPLTEAITYTSYNVNFCLYDGTYKAYGHSTKKHNLGAIRKETGALDLISCFACDDMLIIRATLPFSELNITGIPEKQSLCVSAEIYRNHYGIIYHKLNSHHSEPGMSLIEIK